MSIRGRWGVSEMAFVRDGRWVYQRRGCPKCGKRARAGQVACWGCGTGLLVDIGPVKVGPEAKAGKKKRKGVKARVDWGEVVLVGLAAVVVLGGLLWVWVTVAGMG